MARLCHWLWLNLASSLAAQCQEGGSVWSSLSGFVLLLLHGNQRPGWGKHGQELPGGKHGLLSTLPLSGIPPLSSLDKHAASCVLISMHNKHHWNIKVPFWIEICKNYPWFISSSLFPMVFENTGNNRQQEIMDILDSLFAVTETQVWILEHSLCSVSFPYFHSFIITLSYLTISLHD